jgi:2-iminobutanoate/2-iminopropanoate deaminase
MTERTPVVTDLAPAAVGPYSQAVASGGLLFCSGQVALVPGGGDLLGEPVAVQARQCLENLAGLCEGAGTSLDRAVKVNVYLTDMSAWGELNEVYAGFFTAAPPARAVVGVAALPVGALVEVEAVIAL